jgi:hypothetical protein
VIQNVLRIIVQLASVRLHARVDLRVWGWAPERHGPAAMVSMLRAIGEGMRNTSLSRITGAQTWREPELSQALRAIYATVPSDGGGLELVWNRCNLTQSLRAILGC